MSSADVLKLIEQAAAEEWTALNLSRKGSSLSPKVFEHLSRLANLQSLDLRDNQLREIPEHLSRLANLQRLYLSSNQLREIPEHLSRLANLQRLYLSYNPLREIPEHFSRLANLQSLSLRDNQLRSIPEHLSRLANLQRLDLSYNPLTEIPEHLSRLVNLDSLNLSANRITEIPEHLSRLTQLQSLSLRSNQFTEIPEHLSRLANLDSLNLSANRITEIPEHLSRLTQLQSLYLSSNQLTEIPEHLSWLTNLQHLSLRSNQITWISEHLFQLTKLRSLDLSVTNLTKIPESLSQLTKLQQLFLSHNQISEIPASICYLKNLKHLDLKGNPLDQVPPEIRKADTKTILNYCKQRLQAETDYLYEAKLLIIGEPGAGKTTLANKILDPTYPLQPQQKSTEGIDVIPWHFTLPDGQPFRVNIWDFGGQEIYHATHQFFLTKRSLYALVADSRKEDTDFFYWLNIVELLSDNSPLLIIKNEKQDRQREIEEQQLRGRFSHLKETLPTNLKTNRNLTTILDHIHHYITHLPHVGSALPKTWLKVRHALEQDPRNHISQDTFFDLCKSHGFRQREDILVLSGYLHDLGVFLHFQDDPLLRKTVILKPTWGTAAVYKVLDNKQVRHNQGCFTLADLDKIWRDPQYDDMRPELLQLMMKFKLCYKIPNRDPKTYIAPQLLPINQPDYPWDDNHNLILRYEYEFMPKGIVTRFIVEMHRQIEDQAWVWRTGVVLSNDHARAEVMEDYDKRHIRVRVQGTHCIGLLETIRHEFRKIHDSYARLRYQELIPCNCYLCKGHQNPEAYGYQLLLRYLKDGQDTIDCRRSYVHVDVRGLLNDIGDRAGNEVGKRSWQRRTRPEEWDDRDYDDDLEDDRDFPPRRKSDFPMQVNFINTNTNTNTNTQQENPNMSNTINQYGQGDNIAGDKVMGDKIHTQIKNNPDLAQAARDIRALLDELSEEYNPNTTKGQGLIGKGAIEAIQTNPTLKTRITNALKSAGEEALVQAIGGPIAKALVAGAKGFLE